MSLEAGCVIVMTLALLWGQVLGVPLQQAWRRWRRTREEARPKPTLPTMQILLTNPHGDTEHEIALHERSAPDRYVYGGRDYRRRRLRGEGPDVIWEYQRQ